MPHRQPTRPHPPVKPDDAGPCPTPSAGAEPTDARRGAAGARASTALHYLSKGQVVAATGLSPATVERYKAKGRLRTYQPGGRGSRVLYVAADILTLGRQGVAQAIAPTPPGAQRSSPTDSASDSSAADSLSFPTAAKEPSRSTPARQRPGRRPRWRSVGADLTPDR